MYSSLKPDDYSCREVFIIKNLFKHTYILGWLIVWTSTGSLKLRSVGFWYILWFDFSERV